jgi:hypothetical protein
MEWFLFVHTGSIQRHATVPGPSGNPLHGKAKGARTATTKRPKNPKAQKRQPFGLSGFRGQVLSLSSLRPLPSLASLRDAFVRQESTNSRRKAGFGFAALL